MRYNAARPPVRLENALEDAGRHFDHRIDPGSRHRRQHLDLQPDQRLSAPPLSVPQPRQIAVLAARKAGDSPFLFNFSYPALVDFRKQAASFADLFGYQMGLAGLSADNKADQFFLSYVTGNYFSALGIQPLLGRAGPARRRKSTRRTARPGAGILLLAETLRRRSTRDRQTSESQRKISDHHRGGPENISWRVLDHGNGCVSAVEQRRLIGTGQQQSPDGPRCPRISRARSPQIGRQFLPSTGFPRCDRRTPGESVSSHRQGTDSSGLSRATGASAAVGRPTLP